MMSPPSLIVLAHWNVQGQAPEESQEVSDGVQIKPHIADPGLHQGPFAGSHEHEAHGAESSSQAVPPHCQRGCVDRKELYHEVAMHGKCNLPL